MRSGSRPALNHKEGSRQMSWKVFSRFRHALAAAAVGCGVAMSLAAPAGAADLYIANDPCDLEIVAPGKGAGVANAVEAAPGDVVHLTADGFCTPQVGPVLDRVTNTFATGLVAGNGPALDAPGVTLDLNGHSVTSLPVDLNGDGIAGDVFHECQALTPPADCENAGVSVANKGTTATNLSLTPSVVRDFTSGFNVSRAEGSKIVGGIVDPVAGTVAFGGGNPSRAGDAYNLRAANSRFGSTLAVDRSKVVTVDTVWLQSLTAAGGDGLGADLKRSDQITLQNSRVDADVTGVRFKQGNSFYALRNSLVNSDGGTGVIVRTINDSGSSGGVVYGIFGNVIRGTGGDGINVGGQSRSIPISGNTIADSAAGCGLTVSLDSTVSDGNNVVVNNFTATSPLLAINSFANNGTNLCRR